MSSRLRLTAGVAAAGVIAALPGVYLATLSVAARRRPAQSRLGSVDGSPPMLAVLIPAHNEELLISRCLDSLAASDYPAVRREFFVVADNCSDGTAAIAQARGSTVLQRHDLANRGKGPALRWAIDRLLRERPDIDAFVVVDADSVTDAGMLSALAAVHERGAAVVQADYEALIEGDDPRSLLRAAAFLLFHRVRFTGKTNLGLSCSLVGNGMLFSREICQQVPWSAFSEVEDLEYGLQLRLAGVHLHFAADAHLDAPVATAGPAAEVQRTRWEGGRARLTRQYLPVLVREVGTGRRADLWDAAADLAVPPLGVLAATVALGAGAVLVLRATGSVGTVALVPWSVAALAIPAHVVVGLRTADAPPAVMAALARAPQHVALEMATRLRALLPGSRPQEWVRTPREPAP